MSLRKSIGLGHPPHLRAVGGALAHRHFGDLVGHRPGEDVHGRCERHVVGGRILVDERLDGGLVERQAAGLLGSEEFTKGKRYSGRIFAGPRLGRPKSEHDCDDNPFHPNLRSSRHLGTFTGRRNRWAKRIGLAHDILACAFAFGLIVWLALVL